MADTTDDDTAAYTTAVSAVVHTTAVSYNHLTLLTLYTVPMHALAASFNTHSTHHLSPPLTTSHLPSSPLTSPPPPSPFIPSSHSPSPLSSTHTPSLPLFFPHLLPPLPTSPPLPPLPHVTPASSLAIPTPPPFPHLSLLVIKRAVAVTAYPLPIHYLAYQLPINCFIHCCMHCLFTTLVQSDRLTCDHEIGMELRPNRSKIQSSIVNLSRQQ